MIQKPARCYERQGQTWSGHEIQHILSFVYRFKKQKQLSREYLWQLVLTTRRTAGERHWFQRLENSFVDNYRTCLDCVIDFLDGMPYKACTPK